MRAMVFSCAHAQEAAVTILTAYADLTEHLNYSQLYVL